MAATARSYQEHPNPALVLQRILITPTFRPADRRDDQGTRLIRFVSFIIPAHGEEACLPGTLEALRAAAERLGMGVGHEVIVACDACTDRTPEIARSSGASAVEFHKRHIAACRNTGAAATRRDAPAHEHLLVFIDADTQVQPESLREAFDAVASGHAVGGGAPVRFDGRIPLWSRALVPVVNTMFRWSRLTGGCFFFVRRDHFEAAGGWDEALYAGEEVFLARSLKRLRVNGAPARFHIVRTPVLTSGRKLRIHSGFELLGLLARHALSGGRLITRRDALPIWYGPRRPDPP